MESRAHTPLSSLLEAFRRDPSRPPTSCPVLIEGNETLAQERVYTTLDAKSAADISLGAPQDPRVHMLHKAADSEFPDLIALGRGLSADLSINNSSVSKLHAYIHGADNGSWEISDADSRNGTWVNHERLARGSAIGLQDGVEISLGQAIFLFYSPEGLRRFLETRL